MTVSIAPMTIAYYLREALGGDAPVQRDATAYYTGSKNPPGRWYGQGLSRLGLTDGERVDPGVARRVYDRFEHPVTGEALGRRPVGENSRGSKSRAGYDLSFAPPKSVSALWAVAGPEVQSRIREAHTEAVMETLAWVEQELLVTRAGHKGKAKEKTQGLICSLFDHWDTRDGDPHLHTHAVILNRVASVSDGKIRAVHAHRLYRYAVALSQRYNNLVMDKLHTSLGALPEQRGTVSGTDPVAVALSNITDDHTADFKALSEIGGHRVELAGVPDAVITEFSQRAQAIEHKTRQLREKFVKDHGDDPDPGEYAKLRRQAWGATRTPKPKDAIMLGEQLLGWQARAGRVTDVEQMLTNALGHDNRAITADALTEEQVKALGVWAIRDASHTRSTFGHHNLMTSAEKVTGLIRCTTGAEREALTGRVIAAARGNEELVCLTAERPEVNFEYQTKGGDVISGREVFSQPVVYSTATTMDRENYLIRRATTSTAPGITDDDALSQALEEYRTAAGYRLSEDQREATRQVLTEKTAISGLIGPAGTGKTSTTRAIAAQWQAHYGQSSVVGLAPSAAAARVLGSELGVSAENTAKWLYESIGEGAQRRYQRVQDLHRRLDELDAARKAEAVRETEAAKNSNATGEPRPAEESTARKRKKDARARYAASLEAKLAGEYAAQARYTVQKGQLLIIDEASMASNHQLAALAEQAEAAGAKVLLVGDPAQLEAVEAGGFLGHLERHFDPAKLSSVFRFEHQWEAEASLQLRHGDPAALDSYAEHGRLHQAEDPAEAAYQAWKADTGMGRASVLIAATGQQVAELNHRAQQERISTGEVDPGAGTVRLRGSEQAGVGDVVLARQNNRHLKDSDGAFVTNGTRMRVEAVLMDGSAQATVEATGARITLDRGYLKDSVELGYATTAHRAQGITVDTAHAVATGSQSRELLYVAMTRGRHANHTYISLDDHHDDGQDHGAGMFTPEAGPQSVEEALRPVLGRSRAELSAVETQAKEHGWAKDLGRLQHEHRYLQNHPSDPENPEAVKQHAGALEALSAVISRQASIKAQQGVDEKPEWAADTLRDYSADQAKQVLEAAVRWRAASDQNDATTLLGRTPSRADYLRSFYDTAVTQINDVQAQDTPKIEEKTGDGPSGEDFHYRLQELLDQRQELIDQHHTGAEEPVPEEDDPVMTEAEAEALRQQAQAQQAALRAGAAQGWK